MMASSFAFWRFVKLGKRANWLQGREGAHVVPCHAPVCCRHFSRPEICRPLPSSLARARLLGPIRRTSVAIRRRRHCRRLLEKCHLQSAASVGGSAIPRGSLFTSTVMMKLNTAFHLARSLQFLFVRERVDIRTTDVICKRAVRLPASVRRECLFPLLILHLLGRGLRAGITQLFTHIHSDEGKARERVRAVGALSGVNAIWDQTPFSVPSGCTKVSAGV